MEATLRGSFSMRAFGADFEAFRKTVCPDKAQTRTSSDDSSSAEFIRRRQRNSNANRVGRRR
jgi:hypothetical protein